MSNQVKFEKYIKRSKGNERLVRKLMKKVADKYNYSFEFTLNKYKGIQFCIACHRPSKELSISNLCYHCSKKFLLSPLMDELIEAIL